MNILFFLIWLLSLPTILIFIGLTIFQYAVKKDSEKGKKQLKFLGGSFTVMILSFIIFIINTDSTEKSSDEKIETTAASENTSVEKSEEELEKERQRIKTQYEIDKAAREAKAKKEKEDAEKTEENEVVEFNNPSLDKKIIERTVYESLGNTNNLKKDTIYSLDIFEEDKAIILALNAGENVTVNLTKKGMWKNSKKVLEPLSKIDGLELIIIHWYYPLIDAYGNEKDVMVMAFEVNKETLNKINWDNFLTDNVPNVVSSYFEHEVLKE
ncbi:hypothetical protein A0U40_07310 [[Bacillus] sp. KCTC 13219]|nr:hypothetical protein A0U40_07310 [[Bacillus] sp. KCTC 13219]